MVARLAADEIGRNSRRTMRYPRRPVILFLESNVGAPCKGNVLRGQQSAFMQDGRRLSANNLLAIPSKWWPEHGRQSKGGCMMLAGRFLRKVLTLLRLGLLLPVLPVIWFGPITHPEINRRALRKAKELKAAGGAVNTKLLRAVSQNEEAFVFGGNSADAISTQHVLNGIAIYDYAHNQIPNLADGSPLFGYRLITKWLEHENGPAPYPPRELAVACGWLAHQIADFYPHYAPVDAEGNLVKAGATNGTRFDGYANSHRVLGTSFYPEILREHTTLDHGLIEFFHDFAIVQEDAKGYYDNARVELFDDGPRNLLTETSETFRDSRCRIPPEHISHLRDDFNLIIKGTRLLIEVLRVANPNLATTLATAFPSGVDYVSLSAERVVEDLFLKSDEEIKVLAVGDGGRNEPAGLAPEVLGGGASVVFPIAHQVASAVNTKAVIDALRAGSGIKGKVKVWFIPVEYSVQGLLEQLMGKVNLGKLAKRANGTNAFLSFLGVLLSSSKPDLGAARQEFGLSLRPVVDFPGVAPGDLGAGLAGELKKGAVEAVVVPAVSTDQLFDPASPKALDPETLLFRIDGYDGKSGFFDLESQTDSTGRMFLRGRLKEALNGGGMHHVFIDVHDRSGVHSHYADIQVPLNGGRPASKSADEDGF